MTQRTQSFKPVAGALAADHTKHRSTAARATSWTRLTAAAGLAVLLSACDGRSPAAPTAAAEPVGSASATFALSGRVSEVTTTGTVPVEGAAVLEANSQRHATTDRDGYFTISGMAAASIVLSVTKPGYVTNTKTLMIGGDTRLDFQVERAMPFTLAGTVFEVTPSGRVSLEAVELYCDSCGSPEGHTFTHTDARGFYSFSWASNGQHPLFVRKAGYEIFDPTGKLKDQEGRITATVNGNTQFDIEMVRR